MIYECTPIYRWPESVVLRRFDAFDTYLLAGALVDRWAVPPPSRTSTEPRLDADEGREAFGSYYQGIPGKTLAQEISG